MKTLFTLFISLFSFITYAQRDIVNIPDANFKAALIADGVDTNGDGEIQVTETVPITSIDIWSEDISDLTGIEAFANLTILDCHYNNLTSVDLSGNINLEELNISYNELTYLDLTHNTLLTTVNCSGNEIVDLYVLFLDNLSELNCENNNIVNIDLTTNTSLTNLNCSYNNLISLELITNTELTTLDCHFNWTDFTTLNIDACTKLTYLDCSSNNLSLLNLINNTLLTYVDCESNELNNIELSSLTQLTDLICSYNNFTNLDLSNNTLLQTLYLSGNELPTIDLSNNVQLTDLKISSNEYTTIDLSNNILLEKIRCSLTDITALDLSMLPNLTDVYCTSNLALEDLNIKNGHNTAISDSDLWIMNNSLLTCVQVDNAGWSTTHWTHIDVSFSEDCTSVDATYVPDDIFEQALVDLGYDTLPLDDYVPTDNIIGVTSLNLLDKGIYDLTGIEDFAALTSLNVNNNNLSTLDVSNNSNLESLEAPDNDLTDINIGIKLSLEYLNFSDNNIASVDLSGCPNLETLYCESNNLSTLDVDNNVNLKLIDCDYNNLTALHLNNCPDLESLFCAHNAINNLPLINNTQLQEINVSSNNLSAIHTQQLAYLTEFVCDDNQIAYLDMKNNVLLDKIHCMNNDLHVLNMKNGNNNNVANNDFKATGNPDLDCIQVDNAGWSTSNWTNIDATSSFNENCMPDQTFIPDTHFEQALIDLGLDTTLDFYVTTSHISSVFLLDVHAKNIEDLTGIEDFTALKGLNVNNNSLDFLNVGNNNDLEDLQCLENNLEGLLLNNNPELITLKCIGNNLVRLDLSDNSNLTFISCSDNNLVYLDVRNGNNEAITDFYASDNPDLTCIYVNDPAYCTSNWTDIDPASTFVADSFECTSLSNTEITDFSDFKLYPNPVTDLLNIESVYTISKVQVFDSMGKQVIDTKDTNISFKNLQNGLYLVKIQDENGNLTVKKIIKN